MNSTLSYAFQQEMTQAKVAYKNADFQLAFLHLERAHILGQRFFILHLITHWWMLKIGFQRLDSREIFGQVLRLIAVVPGYLFGWVPIGNTGGADVSAIKPMPLPQDLKRVLEGRKNGSGVLNRIILWVIIFILSGIYFLNR